MRDLVLLIGSQDDLNLHRIAMLLQQQDIKYFELDPVFFAPSAKISASSARPGTGLLLECADGSEITIDDVGAVWSRGAGYTAGFDTFTRSIEHRVRCESLYAFEYLWETLSDRLWLNNILRGRVAANRLIQKKVAKEAGLMVPEYVVTQSEQEARAFMRAHSNKAIIKLISQGGLAESGPAPIMTTLLTEEQLCNWSASAPVLLEEYIDKVYEIRAAVVGNKVFAGAIDTSSSQATQIDSRNWVAADLTYYPVDLDEQLVHTLVSINRTLGLEYSSFDLAYSAKSGFYFFETNPSGQWTFLEAHTGFAITEAIVERLRLGLNNAGR